ncbi:MAG TPA: DUF2071 domain-containing protein [Acidisarcina sp.]
MPISDILSAVAHRPWPIPATRWAMTQRWNDLLFAHWPVPAEEMTALLPSGLVADTFDGSAWVGIVPFWMDRIQMHGAPMVPGANRFAELNLRTYVRQRNSNAAGVYFFSLDAANPIAVAVARMVFQLPYFWARMSVKHHGDRDLQYSSERLFTRHPARFKAVYRSLGPTHALEQSRAGSIEHFLTERYCLYTTDSRGELHRGNIHHLPWPLERAEAEIQWNDLPTAHGIHLPDVPPLLHYARELTVYVWSLERVPVMHSRRAAAAVAATRNL